MAEENRYKQLLECIFFDKKFGAFKKGDAEIEFEREDLRSAARSLGIELPKNLGDVVYAIRYRTPMPKRILETQPKGKEWIVEGVGRSKYKFHLVAVGNTDETRSGLLRREVPEPYSACCFGAIYGRRSDRYVRVGD